MHSFSAHDSITAALDGYRELDARTNRGFDVRLWWDPADDSLAVSVADTRTGLAFELPVRDGEAPLDVFHHPFSYAADRALRLPAGAAGRVPDRSTAGGIR